MSLTTMIVNSKRKNARIRNYGLRRWVFVKKKYRLSFENLKAIDKADKSKDPGKLVILEEK